MKQLAVRYPIVQAPMAGVSTAALAAAVTNAGGLGSIALGASNLAEARQSINEARALTNGPLNFNVFCHRPALQDSAKETAWLKYLEPFFREFGENAPVELKAPYKSFVEDAEMFELILREKPAVVSFHFGLPKQEWIDAFKQKGILTFASATTLAEAKMIERAHVDFIVAQGFEAGGHRGVFEPEKGDAEMGTFALVQILTKSCSLPVIAAGGIMDGRGIASAMSLGAFGVQLGTAFILCPESNASAAFRDLLQSGRGHYTGVTSAISGRPARGIINRMFTDVDRGEAPPLPDYPIVYDAGKALNKAALARGSSEFAAFWAGQGAALVRSLPAAELISLLVDEWRQASLCTAKPPGL